MTKAVFRLVFWFCFFIMVTVACGQADGSQILQPPISHAAWTAQLQQYVGEDGMVDYRAWRADVEALDAYLNQLKTHHPNDSLWSEAEALAYWINAYNAFTVKLILDHPEVSSIKEVKKGIPMINSVWEMKWITIDGQQYSLGNIEHKILRKQFDEPRIHFAINCASFSCPKLARQAYEAATIEEQLGSAAVAFINDPYRNKLSKDQLQLSKIFKWFRGDFTKTQKLQAFLNQYAKEPVALDANITYLDYNWQLNQKNAASK